MTKPDAKALLDKLYNAEGLLEGLRAYRALLAEIERLQRCESERDKLRDAMRSVHWHGINRTVNSSVFVDIADAALAPNAAEEK
jgi:hypothetical protein